MDGEAERGAAAVDLVELFRAQAGGLTGAVRAVLGERFDAQEVLQEAFLRAWRDRAGFRAARDPRAWVFVLTLNLARDLRRRARRRGAPNELSEHETMELIAREPGPEEAVVGREALGRARAAIAALDETEKEVFLLRTSAGLSFESVAEALSIPVGTAKTRMRRALARLRRALDGVVSERGPREAASEEGGAR